MGLWRGRLRGAGKQRQRLQAKSPAGERVRQRANSITDLFLLFKTPFLNGEINTIKTEKSQCFSFTLLRFNRDFWRWVQNQMRWWLDSDKISCFNDKFKHVHRHHRYTTYPFFQLPQVRNELSTSALQTRNYKANSDFSTKLCSNTFAECN